MPMDFTRDFQAGADLYLKAMGIKEGQERTRILNEVSQNQMLEAQQKMAAMQEQIQKQKNFQEVIEPKIRAFAQVKESGSIIPYRQGYAPTTPLEMAQEITQAGMMTGGMPKSTEESLKLWQGLQPKPLEPFTLGPNDIRFEGNRPVAQGAQVGQPVKDNDPLEIRQFEIETGLSPSKRGTYEYQEAISKWRGSKKESSIPSAGNAVDLAIKRKFGSSYLKDPTKTIEADKWLASDEGKQFVRDARDDLTPQSITYLQTDEGYVPAVTKGIGIGTTKAPTGLGKPTPPGAAEKIGGIEGMLNDIKSVKSLYKFGTKEEQANWVGPVSGRWGTIEEKYTGTATDEQVQFYSYVRDMQDALLRARSGAQINEQEFKRLAGFLPDVNVPAPTFKARLIRFEKELNNVLETKKKALVEGGYGSRTPRSPTTGGNPQKTIIKQFISPSTGKTKYIYSDGTEEIR